MQPACEELLIPAWKKILCGKKASSSKQQALDS